MPHVLHLPLGPWEPLFSFCFVQVRAPLELLHNIHAYTILTYTKSDVFSGLLGLQTPLRPGLCHGACRPGFPGMVCQLQLRSGVLKDSRARQFQEDLIDFYNNNG